MAKNKEILESIRELRNDIKSLRLSIIEIRTLYDKSQVKWLTGEAAAKLLGRNNARYMQELRDKGKLKSKLDYFFNGKGFMYREERIAEIRQELIIGNKL